MGIQIPGRKATTTNASRTERTEFDAFLAAADKANRAVLSPDFDKALEELRTAAAAFERARAAKKATRSG